MPQIKDTEHRVPVEITKEMVDGAFLAKSMIAQLSASERDKLIARYQRALVRKASADSVYQLLATVGFMTMSALDDARESHQRQDRLP